VGGDTGPMSILLQEYLDESEDLINEIEQVLLALEKGEDHEHLWNCLMRNLHSFKGSAQLMGLEPIVSIAHGMETIVVRFRQGQEDVDTAFADLFFTCIDTLRALSEELSVSGTCAQDISPVLQRIDRLTAP
jgi:two-component system chemotaxis sensor kinase CheA